MKIIGLVVLALLLLFLTACPTNKVIEARTTAAPSAEKPQYGGTLTVPTVPMLDSFDPYKYGVYTNLQLSSHCYEPLAYGNWAKGRSGSGEFRFNSGQFPVDEPALAGILARSWEVAPDGLTITVRLREGVRFHNKLPANGRELTAEDVKYCFDRRLGTGNGFTKPAPNLSAAERLITGVQAVDSYTVAFTLREFNYLTLLNILSGYNAVIYAPELVQEYGDNWDWRVVCGTGPYVLTDYVPASHLTFERNPLYYLDDELHPGNRLPYVERLTYFIVPGAITVSLVQSGQTDFLPFGMRQEWVEGVKKTNPDVQIREVYGIKTLILIQRDAPSPLTDVKVRQALQMAIDGSLLSGNSGNAGLQYASMMGLTNASTPFTAWRDLPSNI